MAKYLDYAGLQRYDGIVERKIEKAIESILPEKTATGNPISISDASGFNAKSAKVTMLPIQSGSGDPSPTNIRPIIGRDSVDLTRTGKNLAKPYVKSSGIISYDENGNVTVNGTTSGTLYVPTTYQAISDGMLFKLKAGTYIPSLSNPYPNGDIFVNVVSKNNTNLSQGNAFTLSEDTEVYVRVVVKTGTYNNWTSGIQLEKGSTATTYEPYRGETHTATFPDTVYGGNYEFVNGVGSEKYGIVDLGTLNWTFDANNHRFQTVDLTATAKGNATTDMPNILCECYPVFKASDTATTIFGITLFTSGRYVYLRVIDANYSTLADFVTAVTGKKVCYQLATPQEITLSPETIALLKGNNVLTTDGDNAELKYSVSLDSLINSSNSTRALNLTKSALTAEPTEEIEVEKTKEVEEPVAETKEVIEENKR